MYYRIKCRLKWVFHCDHPEMSLTMACNGLGVIIFCLWVRQQAQSTPSQGQVSVDESYRIIDVSTVDRKQICFVGMSHVIIFRFELCVLCHLYI